MLPASMAPRVLRVQDEARAYVILIKVALRPETKSDLLTFPDPPGLLSISCQVPNHMLVRCSWVDLAKTFLPGEYSASFR